MDSKSTIRSISEATNELYKRLEEFGAEKRVITGSTGALWHGFILSLVRNAARVTEIPVGLVCTVTSDAQVAALLACISAGIDWHALYSGDLGKPDWQRLMGAAMQEVSALPIVVADADGVASTSELLAIARDLVVEHRAGLLVVDHVDPTTVLTQRRGQEAVDEVRGFRRLARELNTPVILHQHEPDGCGEPTRYFYRASDLVIALSDRGRVGGQDSDQSWVRATVEKNRCGLTGFCDLFHDHRTLSFREIGRTA